MWFSAAPSARPRPRFNLKNMDKPTRSHRTRTNCTVSHERSKNKASMQAPNKSQIMALFNKKFFVEFPLVIRWKGLKRNLIVNKSQGAPWLKIYQRTKELSI